MGQKFSESKLDFITVSRVSATARIGHGKGISQTLDILKAIIPSQPVNTGSPAATARYRRPRVSLTRCERM
jgi:hypothetical protein